MRGEPVHHLRKRKAPDGYSRLEDRAKQTPGYDAQKSADTNVIRYSGLDGKQRFEYRESWSLNTKVLTHVRCSLPLLATSNAAWIAAYEAGCAQIMQSTRH